MRYEGVVVTTAAGRSTLLSEATATVKCRDDTVHEIAVQKKGATAPERTNIDRMQKGILYRVLTVHEIHSQEFPVFRAKLKSKQASATIKLVFRDIESESFPYRC